MDAVLFTEIALKHNPFTHKIWLNSKRKYHDCQLLVLGIRENNVINLPHLFVSYQSDVQCFPIMMFPHIAPYMILCIEELLWFVTDQLVIIHEKRNHEHFYIHVLVHTEPTSITAPKFMLEMHNA